MDSIINYIPVTNTCIITTAKRFNLSSQIIKAVLAIENGSVGLVKYNQNGTYDMGPMQINSIWLKNFASYVDQNDIIYNGCINIQVGAWILRYNINNANGNFWKGIGNYHSKSPGLHRQYINKIYSYLTKVTN